MLQSSLAAGNRFLISGKGDTFKAFTVIKSFGIVPINEFNRDGDD